MNIKKISILALLLIGVFNVGCKSNNISEPTSRNYETYIGEIKSLGGIKVNKSITHLFEDREGTIFYAYSDRYDLNNDDYLSTEIEAYGVVMTFDDLDKSVFEIRRISTSIPKDEEEINVESTPYKNLGLGFQFNYPSNWQISEFNDSVKVTSPVQIQENDDGTATDNSSADSYVDYVIVAKIDADLKFTSDDDKADRASEIRDFVRSNYDSLVGVSSEISYVGQDKQFAVVYKPVTGDESYFIPTGSYLVEFSFLHPGEDDKVSNFNIFSEMLNSFRFIGSSDSDLSDAKTSDSQEPISNSDTVEGNDNSIITEVKTTSVEQVVFDKFREFESNPFHFKISFPSHWYYSGGASGYDFSDEPIEDESVTLVRLDLNATKTEGTLNQGGLVKLTVKVGDVYYTLSGDPKFTTLIEKMASSIEAIDAAQ